MENKELPEAKMPMSEPRIIYFFVFYPLFYLTISLFENSSFAVATLAT